MILRQHHRAAGERSARAARLRGPDTAESREPVRVRGEVGSGAAGDLRPLRGRRIEADLRHTDALQCSHGAVERGDVVRLRCRRLSVGAFEGLPAVAGLDVEPPRRLRGCGCRARERRTVHLLLGDHGVCEGVLGRVRPVVVRAVRGVLRARVADARRGLSRGPMR